MIFSEIYKSLYNSRAKGISGKNKQPAQPPWRGAPWGAGPSAPASA